MCSAYWYRTWCVLYTATGYNVLWTTTYILNTTATGQYRPSYKAFIDIYIYTSTNGAIQTLYKCKESCIDTLRHGIQSESSDWANWLHAVCTLISWTGWSTHRRTDTDTHTHRQTQTEHTHTHSVLILPTFATDAIGGSPVYWFNWSERKSSLCGAWTALSVISMSLQPCSGR